MIPHAAERAYSQITYIFQGLGENSSEAMECDEGISLPQNAHRLDKNDFLHVKATVRNRKNLSEIFEALKTYSRRRT